MPHALAVLGGKALRARFERRKLDAVLGGKALSARFERRKLDVAGNAAFVDLPGGLGSRV